MFAYLWTSFVSAGVSRSWESWNLESQFSIIFLKSPGRRWMSQTKPYSNLFLINFSMKLMYLLVLPGTWFVDFDTMPLKMA